MKNNGSKTGNNLESHLDLFQVLDLRGNPLTAVLRYRENVIGSCGYLTTIDGKTVEAQSRLLMTNMRKMRLKKDSLSSSGSSGTLSSAGNSQSSNIVTSTSHILPNNCNDVVSTTGNKFALKKEDRFILIAGYFWKVSRTTNFSPSSNTKYEIDF